MKVRISKNRGEVEVGCKYANNCFECPFDDCILPMNAIRDTEEEYLKDREVLLGRVKYVKELRDKEWSIRRIAKELNCAERTVKNDLIIAKTLLEEDDAKQD